MSNSPASSGAIGDRFPVEEGRLTRLGSPARATGAEAGPGCGPSGAQDCSRRRPGTIASGRCRSAAEEATGCVACRARPYRPGPALPAACCACARGRRSTRRDQYRSCTQAPAGRPASGFECFLPGPASGRGRGVGLRFGSASIQRTKKERTSTGRLAWPLRFVEEDWRRADRYRNTGYGVRPASTLRKCTKAHSAQQDNCTQMGAAACVFGCPV